MISVRRFLQLAVVFLVVLAAGCSTPPQRVEQEWTGRFSVSTIFKGKADRDSGTFVLTRGEERLDLLLKGPLGAVAAEVEETPAGAVLRIPNEQPITAKDSSLLAQRLVGVPVSLQDLARWLETGIPRTEDLESLGWSVELERDNDKLRRITVEREESPEDASVKLILLPSQTK